MRLVALDPGYSTMKCWTDAGYFELQSAVAVADAQEVRVPGLRRTARPLKIITTFGKFFVGTGAHDWGRAVENLDLDRLTGSPEMTALICGIMTKAGVEGDVDIVVGLPIVALTGPDVQATVRAVRKYLQRSWRWEADGKAYGVDVHEVMITGQTAGAIFDYFLTDEGKLVPEKRGEFAGEVAILNIGFNTIDLFVARNGEIVQRFTGGEQIGVRRLLSLLNPDGLYTLAEMDFYLRQYKLDPKPALPIWAREVFGFLERQWGNHWKRFGRIICVGGGVELLRQELVSRYGGKVFIPDNPVGATARGLYKFAKMRRERG